MTGVPRSLLLSERYLCKNGVRFGSDRRYTALEDTAGGCVVAF